MNHNPDERPIEGEMISDNPQETQTPPDTTMALVIYALYLASFVVGFTAVVGVVMAYVFRGKGPVWLDEHYRYQVRTFWIGLLYACIAFMLTLVLIGFPLLLALAVWLIVRCVKGFKCLHEKRAPSNVNSWLI
ncbi:DUF4870 family protein [Halomonas sp. HL-93]|uniref:DUF4870 family protein n=1 Tax=Halomonas sp. HL-93 TaxID=1666906 RepID=UPI0006DB9B22|nr:DUF4870 domain-containing protein [Halomonas sp. HL-93]KPQ21406.1 MAG: putative membrane protein [Halomonas sp. HL-93]SBR47290.1 Uncharacterized membrane protein [Halomonas sp. HL-93]